MLASVSDIADKDVKSYFINLEPAIQARLFELLLLIHTAIPSASICMKYGMPTFFDKKSILHIAGWKNHCGIYPQAEAIRVFASELAAFTCSKGAIQISHTQAFPKQVLLDILAYRLKAIDSSKL
jgi:uncharacterized protein YdhG (YjbR/CyaY superfamily)